MEYKKKTIGSLNLHMIKTNCFKTVTIQITFRQKIIKEKITIRNFLAAILLYSSKMYPTKRLFALKLQDLYAANAHSGSYRIGNYYNTDIGISLLDEKYSEKGLLRESLEFLSEVIFNPNIIDNKFEQDAFNVVYSKAQAEIDIIKEDSRKYSLIKMLEKMGPDEAYSYHSFGYKEDFDKITPENLVEYYKEFIRSSIVDIYIIGNIKFNEVEDLIKNKFRFSVFRRTNENIIINHDNYPNKISRYEEIDNTNQAKLSIGCKMYDITEYERNYVLVLYNIILGGSSDSKLFNNVREKQSLCYYVSSVCNKIDNLLLISSGISKCNYEKTIEAIKKEMKSIENGEFTEEDIAKAVQNYISILDEIYDYPSQAISYYYSMELFGCDPPEVRKEKIHKVTKEEIIEVSKKIKMDTIYLLGGDKNA